MEKFTRLYIVIGLAFLITACATSMSPTKVNNTLPTLTKSDFYTESEAENAVESNKCKYLVKGRKYTAPIGLTVNGDLRNGAKGIDEWVKLDGGNAYVLNNYQWVTVDDMGSTQLYVEFDTLLCD